jgi:hypothetical protein
MTDPQVNPELLAGRQVADSGATSNKGVDAELVFETIISGLHWNVLQIGTISLLITACCHRKASWTLRAGRQIIQSNAHIMKAPLRYGADIGLAAETKADISYLYDRLAEVKAATAPLMAGESAYTTSEYYLLAELEVRWRQIGLKAVSIMYVLKPDVKRKLPPQYSEDAQILVRFRMEAANGETRRVGADGEISLPTLSQRRQAPRVMVRAPCRLVLPDLSVPALLFDVSRDGLGMICDHALLDRQQVAVELADGRLLKAIVVRREGDRKGLSLLRPLPSDDPLFPRAQRAEH